MLSAEAKGNGLLECLLFSVLHNFVL